MAKYKGVTIDTKPTKQMADNAKRGMEMRGKQPDSNKCCTDVGLARANQLIDREELSVDVVNRMYSFFSRHEVDKESEAWKEGESKGEQAWLMWGGDAGYTWSKNLVEKMDKIDKESGSDSASNRLGIMVNAQMAKRISRQEIFGTEHIVIEGCGSIIGDSVMNGIFYPLEEVKKLASQSTGIIHAPVSHPQDAQGNFISASSPEGVHQGYVGAISFNYRMDGDRLVRDIAIDPVKAATTEKGRELLERIENEMDTDTSTGLLLYLDETDGYGKDGEPYTRVAKNMMLDHDAILLDERGAATSLQGVGMFANSKGVNEEIEVCEINVNASMPAMKLPLAPEDYTWDADEAIKRIREYTNSQEEPSSNYRRYFMYFDRDNVKEFGSYKLPFADIIDGKPYAVLNAINNASARLSQTDIPDKDKAAAGAIIDSYQKRFGKGEDAMNSEQRKSWIGNLFQKFINFIESNNELEYNTNSNDNSVINNEEDRIMRDFILNKLKEAGVSTDGLSDAELQDAFNKAYPKKDGEAKDRDDDEMDEENMDGEKDKSKSKAKAKNSDESETVSNADLLKRIDSLEAQLNAQNEEELSALADQVNSLNIGINKDQAKALGIDGMKSVLKANGAEVSFNASTTVDAGNSSDYEMPAYD